MLQKTKSMLLKLLMLLCVVCCAVALAFGLAGCSGVTVDRMEINADGDLIVYYSDGSSANLGNVTGGEAEDPVVPEDYSYDPATGVLTITYSDGHTETVTIGGGEESCEHTNVETIQLSAGAWDCSEGGQILEVCDDCGYAHVVDVAPGHVWEEVTIAPTCVKEGYTTQVCEYCGIENSSVERTDITEPTGEHNYSEEGYEVAYPDKTLCEGGWLVHICDGGCGTVEFETLEAPGHTVATWTVNDADPDNADLVAVGYCSECGAQVEIDLPELTLANLKDYTYEITEATEDVNCSASMKAHFTYVDEETGTTVEFDGYLPGGNHTFQGEQFVLPAEGQAYDVSEIPEGMEIAGNNGGVATCADEGAYAVFTCEVCHRPIVVRVRVPHTKPVNATVNSLDVAEVNSYLTASLESLDDLTAAQVGLGSSPADTNLVDVISATISSTTTTVYTLAADCGSYGNGFEIYYCDVCDQVVVDVVEAEHDIVYTMTQLDTDNDGENDTVVVTNDCSICHNLTGDDLVNATLTNYTITETPATCDEEGSRVVTGYNAATQRTETYTEVLATTNHRHSEYGTVFSTNGGPYSVLQYPHVTISGNAEVTSCAAGTVYGVFTCEDCGKPIVITMYYPHTEPAAQAGNSNIIAETNAETAETNAAANHSNVYVKEATCTEEGWRIFFCDVCDKVVTVETPALGHEIVEHVTVSGTGASATYTYTVYCANTNEDGTTNDSDSQACITDILANTALGKQLAAIIAYNGTGGHADLFDVVQDNGTITIRGLKAITEENVYGVAQLGSSTATCTQDGATTYAIRLPYLQSNVLSTSNIIVNDVAQRAAHTLNGKLMDLGTEQDPVYYDPDTTPGITVTGNYPLSCDSEGGLGVFTCEVCGLPIVVHVRDGHTRPTVTDTTTKVNWEGMDTAFGLTAATGEVAKAPAEVSTAVSGLVAGRYYTTTATCTEGSQYIYYCSVCEQWIYGKTAKTGHAWAFDSAEWKEGETLADSYFAVKFECTNPGCDANAETTGAQPETATIKLYPFNVEDQYKVTLRDSAKWDVVDFFEPSHNTRGFVSLEYTITAADFKDVVDDSGNTVTVARTFSYAFSGTATLSSERPDELHHYDFHFVYGGSDDDEVVLYHWFVDSTNEDGEAVRTYYTGTICPDCGEMYAEVQVANGLTNGSVSGDKIPDSDLPIYEDAVKADQAAEQNPAA